MYLIFDTETTGLPKNWRAPISDTDNWPRCVQIAWQLHDDLGNIIENNSYLIKPEGYDIPYESEKIHGISTRLAELQGETLEVVGTGIVPDVYTVPFNSLNFTFNKKLGEEKKSTVDIKVSNILNSKRKSVYQSYKASDKTFTQFNPGTEFSVGYNYNF